MYSRALSREPSSSPTESIWPTFANGYIRTQHFYIIIMIIIMITMIIIIILIIKMTIKDSDTLYFCLLLLNVIVFSL